MTVTDVRRRNVGYGWYCFGHMKLWHISEITGLYCWIVERFSSLGSNLDYRVVSRILRCTAGHTWSPHLWRRDLSDRYAVDGGTDAAGVDSVFPMDPIVMPDKVAISNEGTATQPALEVLPGWMGSNVDSELRLAGEGHRTAIAIQWLLRNVGPTMCCYIALHGKGFIANIASVRSFACMNTFVNIQCRSLGKPFQTCCTFEWSLSSMRPYVDIKIRFPTKRCWAMLASKRPMVSLEYW